MNRRAGFTLVELMLAITLVALMMVVVYGVVVSTIHAQERIEEVTLGTEVGPVILNQVRQDLEAAFVPDAEKDWFVGLQKQASDGDRDRLDFATAVLSYGTEDGAAEARFHPVNETGYQVVDNPKRPGEGILMRRLDPFIDDEPLKGGRLTALYDRVKSFDVKYWDGEQWQEQWASAPAEGQLPRAVKIDLKVLVPDRGTKEGTVLRRYSLTVRMPG